MLSFSQINLHKSEQATLLLGQDLEEKQQVISLISEPHTVANKITGMPRGTTIAYDRSIPHSQPGPRTGIVASNDLRLNPMDNLCTRDCTVAVVKIHGTHTLLASIYLDIKKPVVPQWLEQLVDIADRKKMPMILGIDSNAHSTFFGPDSNARGDELEDFILKHGMKVVNTGDDPTFEIRRGNNLIQTHIDVTLTRDVRHEVNNWRVDRSYNGSDHNTIRFEITTNPSPKTTIRPWSKADWATFSDYLKRADYRVPQAMSMKKLDKLISRIYKVLREALDRACPEITIQQTVHKGNWATDKHAKEKSKVSALYAQAKKHPTDTNWQAYKQADKAFKNMCKKDRNKAWRHFKETLQTEKDMASLARLAQREEKRNINVLTKQDGSSTSPGEETIDLLTETHFPAATALRHVSYNNRRNCLTQALEDKYNDWITAQKITQALAGFEKKKSPGPDGLKPLIFEHLPKEFITVLEVAYKSAIHLAYTPKLWKKTKVIFISKPGKESYDKAKSFRPISLSNYFLKGLERLVTWKMDRALIDYPIHHKQHGFLTGKSTESAISNTTDYIEKHVMNNQHCVGVFLDISSAFDSIRPNHVKRALLDHGGDPEMVQWYYNYITHRDIEVDLHGEKKSFSTGVGFPQGGVCSAKFWLIAFDFAIKIINTYNIEGNGYADDCSALYGGPRLDHAISRLQKMLDSLTAWGKRCGLKFNPEKSVAVVFSRRRKLPQRKLTIDGKEIEYKQEVKYLGVTLDSKHWTKHIKDKTSRAKKYLMHIANITRKNWGPKPKLMRWAYLGIVRPMLSYASMIWGHRSAYHIPRLRRVNRMAINTFGSFPKSTPTAALEVMLDVMPLHLFCKQEALASRTRLDGVLQRDWMGTSNKKTHAVSHLKYWDNALQDFKIDPSSCDRHSGMKWNTGFKINTDSFDGTAKHRIPTQYNAYTDGSRHNDQTGAGYTIHKKGKEIDHGSFRLPDHATVFQAEVAAINKAAIALMRMPQDVQFVKIFVDSRAAILALTNPVVKSKTVATTIESLNHLASRASSVTIVWIPAHKGHLGNERADVLAKGGAQSALPDDFHPVPQPISALKADIRSNILQVWSREWQEDTRFVHTKQFYYSPMPAKAKHVYKLARLELGRFVRLITGHNNLNGFQTKIGLWADRTCRLCHAEEETFAHFLHDCPRLWLSRRELFPTGQPTPDMQWSVRALLDFSYIPCINAAFEGTWAHSDPINQDDLDTSSADLASVNTSNSSNPQ